MLTKCRRWQNIGANKIFALTKYLPWQNICINKISASTKYWCRQNLVVDKMLGGRISSLFWPNRVRSSWLLPKCAVAAGLPAFMGRLSPALYRLICTGPPCRNVTNIGDNKISPNYSSQYLCSQASYKKLVKTKSDHHHCLISVHILMTSKSRPSQRSNAEVSECSKGVW